MIQTKQLYVRLNFRDGQELELIEDATSQGWDREVERHRCATKRIEQLLEELREPFETTDDPIHQ